MEHFELIILEVFDSDDSDLQNKLDSYEEKYIKEYNSYGATGYNMTYGGDAGITGYKFTEEQRQHQKENSKKVANDGRYNLYVYDILKKTFNIYTNCKAFSEFLGFDCFHSSIKALVFHNRYILERSEEKLKKKIEKYKKSSYNYKLEF